MKRLVRFLGWLSGIGCLVIWAFISTLSAQTQEDTLIDRRLERTYQRKAVTVLFVNFGELNATARAGLSNVVSSEKLDAHPIPTRLVRSNFQRHEYQEARSMGQTLLKGFGNVGKNLSPTAEETDPSVVQNDSLLEVLYNNLLMEHGIGNEILAKWFDRDRNGAFTVFGTFQQRAHYNADYATKLRAEQTVRGLSAVSDDADKLVNSSYVLVVDIASIKSLEQIYQEKKVNERPDRGFLCFGYVHVFKLNFSDSIQNIFWRDLWIDKEQDSSGIQARRQAFDEMQFPFSYVQSYTIKGKSIQSKTTPQNDYLRSVWVRKSDEELLEGCINAASNSIIPRFLRSNNKQSSNISTTVSGNIITTSPAVSARIGTKEGLYRNKTFFIMEDRERANGTKFSRKVGVVRVNTVGKNKGRMASDSSTFYQIAGRQPYVGEFLKEKGRDYGFNICYGREVSLVGGLNGFALRADLSFPINTNLYPGLLGFYVETTVGDNNARQRKNIPSTDVFSSVGDDIFFFVEGGANGKPYSRWSIGLLYERYFNRRFHYQAYLGYGVETSGVEANISNVKLNQRQLNPGGRVGMAIFNNVQLQLGINTRLALASPRLSYPDDNDETQRVSVRGTYGQIYPGRAFLASAYLGVRVLL